MKKTLIAIKNHKMLTIVLYNKSHPNLPIIIFTNKKLHECGAVNVLVNF